MASAAGDAGITQLSRGTAVILLIVYASYLAFQLKTHQDLYTVPSEKTPKTNLLKDEKKTDPGTIDEPQQPTQEEEKEEPELTLIFAIILLVVATVFVAICAECLVASIDHLVSSSGISRVFVGLILIPIVGNAAGMCIVPSHPPSRVLIQIIRALPIPTTSFHYTD
jgi:Ca2+:H+ antiporter